MCKALVENIKFKCKTDRFRAEMAIGNVSLLPMGTGFPLDAVLPTKGG